MTTKDFVEKSLGTVVAWIVVLLVVLFLVSFGRRVILVDTHGRSMDSVSCDSCGAVAHGDKHVVVSVRGEFASLCQECFADYHSTRSQ